MTDTTSSTDSSAPRGDDLPSPAPSARDLIGPGRPPWREIPGHREVDAHPSRIGRRAWLVLTSLGVVVTLVIVALGFVFAQAVVETAHAGERELDATITSVDVDGRVTVTGDVDDADLAVVGLVTADGYGLLTGDVVTTDAGVTRDYEHLQGDPPTADVPAALDVYAFPDDPTLVTADAVEVDVAGPVAATEDEPSSLPAWWLPSAPERAVVYVHGRGASRAEGLRLAQIAHDAGWSVLLVSHRGDGIAPDPSDGVGGFGTREWPDLDRALAWLEEQGVERVVLAASSQGAMVAGAWWEQVGRDRDDGLVIGAVFDSALVSLTATLRQQAGNRGIPGPLVRPILAATKAWASLLTGFDANAAEVLFRSEAWDLETLLIHGIDDTQVPVSISEEFADDAPRARLEAFVAGHVRSWNVDPDRYRDLITGFLDERAEV